MKRCSACGGNLFAVPTDTVFERRRGEEVELVCMSCGRVANAQPAPLPLVSRQRISPAPHAAEIRRAAGK